MKLYVTKEEADSLQRKFQIPYIVSARIMNTMEKDGMIGPWTGNINREVYLT